MSSWVGHSISTTPNLRAPSFRMIQNAIFDLGETLIDSNEAHVRSWDRAFRKWGKRFSHAQLHAQVGKGSDEYLPKFLSSEDLHRVGKQIDEYRSHIFKSEYLTQHEPSPECANCWSA